MQKLKVILYATSPLTRKYKFLHLDWSCHFHVPFQPRYLDMCYTFSNEIPSILFKELDIWKAFLLLFSINESIYRRTRVLKLLRDLVQEDLPYKSLAIIWDLSRCPEHTTTKSKFYRDIRGFPSNETNHIWLENRNIIVKQRSDSSESIKKNNTERDRATTKAVLSSSYHFLLESMKLPLRAVCSKLTWLQELA